VSGLKGVCDINKAIYINTNKLKRGLVSGVSGYIQGVGRVKT